VPAVEEWLVSCAADTVTACLERAASPGIGAVVVLAHGAGGHMNDRAMVAMASLLHALGVHVVRFNFPYSEKGSRRPDAMPVLKACVAAVAAHARSALPNDRLILGGRSMGGRAASTLVADGFACDGMLLLAYPLHPAGKPEQLRDDHLATIGVPVLCVNGTRDSLCRRELMDAVVERLSSHWRMHWVEGADHRFHVPKSSGRTDADVLTEIGDVTRRFINDELLARTRNA
jgi:predicted alpha/beta-hydrolase family hydrolase